MKLIDIKNMHQDPKQMHQRLDYEGNVLDQTYQTKLSNAQLIEGFTFMVLSRQQDTYMSQLQRQGRMLTFAPNFGEEALQIGTSLAMSKDDWFVPAFRSNAAMLHLGVPVLNQILYWNGNENGSKMPKDINVLPVNIPIATQCSHAAGIAYGMKLLGKKTAAVCFIGNGGTAEGEFFEAMNMAAIHKWPVVFAVNNNQWAISTPNHLESVSATIAAKAIAVGIPALRVDGNDLLASYEAASEALAYVKDQNGPILVEFVTWRQGPHTTSDNPRIYRSEAMEKEAEKSEPFHRIEKYLIDHQVLTKPAIEKIWNEQMEVVKNAYQQSLQIIDTKLSDVFDYTYEQLPPELAEQKAHAIQWFKEGK